MSETDNNNGTQPLTAKKSHSKKDLRSFKRQESHRLKKGNEFQDNRRARLEREYSLDEYVNDKTVKVQSGTVALPISTRGIGFSLVQHYEAARSRNANFRLDIYKAFRVSHAQLYVKIARLAPSSTTPPEADKPAVLPLDQQIEHSLNIRTNFALVAEIINSCGATERHQCDYRPRLLDPPLLPIPNTDDQFYVYPDPYNLHFGTIGNIVDSLANPLVPREQRRFFRDNNPIPGAIWNSQDLLTNPLEIWPTDYGATELTAESLEFSSALDGLLTKKREWVGRLSDVGTGSGKCSMLATLTTDRPWSLKKLAPMTNDTLHVGSNFYTSSTHCLESVDMLMANVTMVGEYPPEDVRLHYTEEYTMRSPKGQCHFTSCTRADLVGRILFA